VAAALERTEVLINATSLGMTGQPALELDLAPLPKTAIVMDMVYRPLRTPLLQQAQERGNPVADGLSMLIEQAHPSFFGMFRKAPPASVDVRSLCERALGETS
jgi:shikimate dehydrogenase